MRRPPVWKVLLIGGSGGTGKSLLAERLGGHLSVPWLQADDVRLAIQRVTTPDQLPALHFFVADPDVWRRRPQELRDRLIDVARIVSEALEIIVGHHVAHAGAILIEGDGILPSVGAAHGAAVRRLVLFEDDESEIARGMRERGRGFPERSLDEQRAQARLNLLFGRWLKAEAERSGVLVLPAHPRETLFERVVREIAQG